MDQLVVPGSLESLAAIRAYVRAAASGAGLSRNASYRLVLAVDEVASNIALHGYAGVGGGLIDVTAELDQSSLTIRIEDTGAAYALPALQPLELPRERHEVGGVGLTLARLSVDEFQYQRVDERNRHTLVVYRTRS
jgi:anti-sigma regulatory factor (Ser/Thr protein kinase)